MDIKLTGHLNRRRHILPIWLKMKELYEDGMPVSEILKKVKKPDGTQYTRQNFYKVLGILRNL